MTARALLLGAGVLLSGACDGPTGQCQTDMQCAPGSVCLARSCIARLSTSQAVWAIDVVPPPHSLMAAREHASVTFTNEPATLVVDRKVAMATVLERAGGEPIATPSTVHLMLLASSTVPGWRPLTFEADAANEGQNMPYHGTMAVPERLLGSAALLWVAPRGPLARIMGPSLVDVTVAPRVAVTLGIPAETLEFRGRLQQADGSAVPDYEARVVMQGRLSSNLARTDAEGRFVLRMQTRLQALPERPMLELSPVDATQPRPTLLAELPTGTGMTGGERTLAPLKLPAGGPAMSVALPVVDFEGTPVAGATVRVQASLPGAVGGVSRFVRTAQTGADGRATLPLLPGMAGTPITYAVKVLPPATSEASTRCLAYEVGPDPAAMPPAIPAISLPRKVTLQGAVRTADGAAAASLRVRATRQGDLYRPDCGEDVASPAAESGSDPAGRYRLLLDPGDYRLEYEPGPGSALPFHVEDRVSVAVSATRDVTLPMAVLVEGRVLTPDGAQLGAAEIRAYVPGGESTPALLGLATSDSTGRFRLVLPQR